MKKKSKQWQTAGTPQKRVKAVWCLVIVIISILNKLLKIPNLEYLSCCSLVLLLELKRLQENTRTEYLVVDRLGES